MQSESDKDSDSCIATQTCSLRLSVKAFESQQWILIQSFFGCCEFQALLQRPDAALKIELDGNDLGTGALILALWAKKAKKIKKARHVMSLIMFAHQWIRLCQEQVTVVHSSVELLAKRIQGIQARLTSAVDYQPDDFRKMWCKNALKLRGWFFKRLWPFSKWESENSRKEPHKHRYNEHLPEPSCTETAKFCRVSTCQVPEALAVDKAIAAGKSVTFKDLCRLTSLSIHLTASEDFAWQLAAVADAFNTLQQLVELSVAFGRVRSQWITSNGIGDEGCRALGLEVSKLLQLRTLSLDLKCNEVGSSGCRALGHGLGTLIQLTSLSLLLRANHVSHYGCQALRDTLSKLTNLAALSLDLQGNQVCGSYGCRALCDGLGKLMQLTILSLDLRCNRVGDEGCQVLGDSLRKLSKLTSLSLDLNSNLIYETGWQALGDGLGKCLQLTTLSLDVGYNKISPEGCQAVSKVLGNRLSKLPKLTTLSLDLASNGFAPEAFAALRERLKHVAKLQISGQVCWGLTSFCSPCDSASWDCWTHNSQIHEKTKPQASQATSPTAGGGNFRGKRTINERKDLPIECAQGDEAVWCPDRFFCSHQPSAIPFGGGWLCSWCFGGGDVVLAVMWLAARWDEVMWLVVGRREER